MKTKRFFGYGIIFVFGALIFCVPRAYDAPLASRDKARILNDASESISPRDARSAVKYLASPELKGRGSTDSGYILPSSYIAKRLEEYGVLPLGDMRKENGVLKRDYFQSFEFYPFHAAKFTTRNVVGYVAGERSDEFVVICAHYDHLGTSKNGQVYCGADDNASGVASVLEIAGAYSELAWYGVKPSRSIVFGLWSAEEWGLYGSAHFIAHLPAEISYKSISAVINLDMVGRDDPANPNTLYVIGSPPEGDISKDCPELVELNSALNQRPEFMFHLVYTNADSDRSDSYSFFEAAPKDSPHIMTIFYCTGEHPDYHKPSDTYDKIDYLKLSRIAKLAFWLSWELSARPGRLVYAQ